MSLIRINSNTFILKDGKSYIAAGPAKISSLMREKGVEWKEIEKGFVELIKNEHSVAEYGINKTFMYTMKVENA